MNQLQKWQNLGFTIIPYSDILSFEDPYSGKIKKKFISNNGEPKYFEIDLKNSKKMNYYVLDFDINNRIVQQNTLNQLDITNLKNILPYVEISMNNGIHILTLLDHEPVSCIEKKIIYNDFEYTLKIEFKTRILMSPSLNYRKLHENYEILNPLSKDECQVLINKILYEYQQQGILKFDEPIINLTDISVDIDDCNDNLENLIECINEESNDQCEPSIIDEFSNNNQIISKKKSKELDVTEVFQKSFSRISINFEQCFDSSERDLYFYDFVSSFDTFYKFINLPNKPPLTLHDLAMFLYSIRSDRIFTNENDPFYTLSDTKKWIIWTKYYLDLTDILNQIDYVCRGKIDVHKLYYFITKINCYGSKMTENESKIELYGYLNEKATGFRYYSFREIYKLKPSPILNIKTLFSNFILVTISLISLNKETLISINNFLKNYSNNYDKTLTLFAYWQQRTLKYNTKVIRYERKSNNVYIYFDKLFWINVNHNYFEDLVSTILPTADDKTILKLKDNIYNNCVIDINDDDINYVKENLKKHSYVLGFDNCLLRLNSPNGIYITNYKHTDLLTNSGVLNYSLDINSFLTQGIDNRLSLENETRYTAEFCAFIKTLFGKSSDSGKLCIFNISQFIGSLIAVACALNNTKTLEKYTLFLGTGGTGKSKFLTLITSVFSSLCKEMNIRDHFQSKELNSGKADSQEIKLFFSYESGKIADLEQFKRDVADDSYKSHNRNLYTKGKQTDFDSQFCNASYISCGNYGLTYDNSANNLDPLILQSAFIRRKYCIRLTNPLGDLNAVKNSIKTYLENVRGFRLSNENSESYKNLKKGLLFYILDLYQYFRIGTWYNNRNLDCCNQNKRVALEAQYEPLRILREQFIFIKELYRENSDEMNRFETFHNNGYSLKEILLKIKKFDHEELSNIAYSLKLLNLDIFYNSMSNDWQINYIKPISSCTEIEKNAINNPHADILNHDQYYDPKSPLDHLPVDLRFLVNEDLKEKFDNLINHIYFTQNGFESQLEFSKVEIEKEFKNITSKLLLTDFKNFY